MFCRFCGKEVDDVKYCPHCGKAIDKVSFINTDSFKGIIAKVKRYVFNFGYNKLCLLTSVIGTVINMLIRIACNEIRVVRVALAQDDYFTLSATGKVWSVLILAIQISICIALSYFSKKHSMSIERRTYIISGILLIVQIATMIISIPAPY